MNASTQLIVLLFISIGIAAMTKFAHNWDGASISCDPAQIDSHEICFSEIDTNQNLVWIDARSKELMGRNGVKNAYYFGTDSFHDSDLIAQIAENIVLADQVIVYCAGQNCDASHAVAKYLLSLDLNRNIKVLYGGYPSLEPSVLR